jgi:hypothetical protein
VIRTRRLDWIVSRLGIAKAKSRTNQEDEEPTFLLPRLHFFFAGAEEGDDSAAIPFHASAGPEDMIETKEGRQQRQQGKILNFSLSLSLSLSHSLSLYTP